MHAVGLRSFYGVKSAEKYKNLHLLFFFLCYNAIAVIHMA